MTLTDITTQFTCKPLSMTSRLKHEVRDFLLQTHSSDFNPPGKGTIAPIAFSDPYGWNILENEKLKF